MPAPGQMSANTNPASVDWMLSLMKGSAETSLAQEVAALRKEIAALRAELAPVPSLILTGRQALDEFKRLAHAHP